MRPTITPAALASITGAVASRAAKKLDADPRVAEGWRWSDNEVRTGAETVTLAPMIAGAEDVKCTCLLSPRCFHVLAVVSVLPIASQEGLAESVQDASNSPAEEVVEPAQRAAAEEAWRSGGAVLEVGLQQMGTLRLGALLRAAHACRLAGLPRLESAVLAVFEAARDLREQSPTFRLPSASAALAELLLIAERLRVGDASWIGVARRRFEPVTGLKLAGIASAPVLRKGYAGVVSYFTDGKRVYSAQEVLPGDLERARDAYGAQLRFGEISLSHRNAVKSGLLFARAEISADGRLGAGKDVICAATARDASLVARLFEIPIAEQLARADRDEDARLLFVRGVIAAHAERYSLVTEAGEIPLVIPIDDLRFAARDNLARMAERAPSLELVARLDDAGTALAPLAVRFESNEEWSSLDYDRLGKAQIPKGAPPTLVATSELPTLLAPLRRRAERMAIAGARSLPSAAYTEVAREAARLQAALAPTAASVLTQLTTRADPARAWLALHVYLLAAERALLRASWGNE